MNDAEILEKIKKIKDIEKRYELYQEIKEDKIKIKAIKHLDYSYYVSAIKELKEDKDKQSMLTSLETKEEMLSVVESFKSNELKKEYIKEIYQSSNGQKDYNISRIIRSITEEEVQLNCLKYIQDEITRANIIFKFKSDNLKEETIKNGIITSDYPLSIVVNSFENEELKPKYLHYFYSEIIAVDVLKNIKDDEVKKNALNTSGFSEYKNEIAETLEKDENKIEYIIIPLNIKNYKIVTSLKSDNLKKDYYNKTKDLKIKGLLLLSIKDINFIKEEFEKYNEEKTILVCLAIISGIKDEQLKLELINKLNNDLYKKLLLSNYIENKNEILKETKIPKLKKIDKDITIGVELEAIHRNYKEIVELKKILEDWEVIKEPLIHGGIEIKSPILTNEEESMKSLKYVCDMLENNNFIDSEECGGHIHLGGKYFEDEKSLAMFYYIFTNCENIFINISNRAGTTPRPKIKEHAEPIAPLIYQGIKENKFMDIENIEVFINMMNWVQGGRAHTVNIKNMLLNKKTIEIRCPNIEFNYEELINNIYLYATLMKKSNEYAHTNDEKVKEKLLLLSKRGQKEKDKIKILLDLLFEDEKDKKIYQERFDKNIPKLYKLHSNKKTISYELKNVKKRR